MIEIGTPANETPTNTAQVQPTEATQGLRQSNRLPKPSQRLLDSLEASYVAFEAQIILDTTAEVEIDIAHPLALATSADPNVMHLNEAMRQPDWKQFLEAMAKEIANHKRRGHWKVVKQSAIPKGIKVLPAVWSMRRKRRITTQEIYKWKARLTIHGGKQEYGVNYWETYSPIVKWSTICFFLTLAILGGWTTSQLDFVLAYPQAPVKCKLYMEIPRGFTLNGNAKDYALLIKKNLYGQKQAGRVWYKYLATKLIKLGFKQSIVDPCVFYKNGTILMIYVDNTIVCAKTTKEVKEVTKLLKSEFDVDDQGDLADYLGVKVERLADGRILLTQPHLIDQIIRDLHFQSNTKSMETPALATKILQPELDAPDYEPSFHYQSIIGKLNYLEKSTRPDLAYAVHQCARFSSNPKHLHADAVKCIGRYLLGTKDKGLILCPTRHSFDCWVDANFVGNWNKTIAMEDVGTAKSRSGAVILYAACPLLWLSKLQSEIALLTTKAKYISLLTALRKVIPLMDLAEEVKQEGITLPATIPTVHCKAFEDNLGAVELAKTPKLRPRTKHINVKYHHFRDHVSKGKVMVHQVATEDQLADCMTKMCATHLFKKFRKAIMGW